MRKILLSIFFAVAISSINAQDNWTNVLTNSTDTARFYDLLQFGSKLYATSDSSYKHPVLYSSYGTSGTWVKETAINQFLQPGSFSTEDLFSRLATDGTYLFIGSANYSGGSETPQVYRYDGTSYKNHGFISYSQYPYNYQDISAMEFFSATGAPDSIFAFVTSYTGMEVWKTSTTANNPTWVNALTMPTETSIVNDAIVFNGKMYAATCGDANGGFILRTSNGMVWDTVGYGGFGNSGNGAIRSLAIYNNELYAGTTCYNGTGAKLYKSSDGQNWTDVGIALPNLPANYLASISDITVVGYHMFLTAKKDTAGSSSEHVYWSVNGGTFYSSSEGTSISNSPLMSCYGESRAASYNNDFYVTNNNVINFGNICELPMPVAFTTVNGSTTVCQGNNFIGDGSGSTNTSAYEWLQNGSLISTSPTFTLQLNTVGSNNFVFKAYNGGIYDSSYIPVNVVPQVSGTINTSTSFSVCPGQPVIFSFAASSGTPPYSYSWASSTGFPSQGDSDSITFNPTTGGSYDLLVTDANGCYLTTNQSIGIASPATEIRGTVTYSGGTVTDGNVYILKYQPTFAGTDTIATLPLQPDGSYSLSSVNYGDYLVKADPNLSNALYANTISTYNGGFFRWDSATPFLHTCYANDTIDIQLLELPPQNGTASISGYITEGAGYGNRLLGGGINVPFVPGGPLKGIDVKLGKNPSGGIQARTSSDTTTGRYVFVNVPVGTYNIYVDIPNLPMDSLRQVVVTASTDSLPNNNYIADSVSVFVVSSVGIKSNVSNTLNGVKIYPNPANERVFIEFRVIETTATIDITDILGKSLHTETINAEKNGRVTQGLYVGDLPSGVYFVKIRSGNNCNAFKLNVTR